MIKLETILEQHPDDLIFTSHYLACHGISHQLCQRYQKSGYLQSLGYGAWQLTGSSPSFFHGVSCLQQQVQFPIYISGLTALILHQRTHYLYPNASEIWYGLSSKKHLPLWFQKNHFNTSPLFFSTAYLTDHLGYISYQQENQPTILISSVERATLECFHQSPKKISLTECYENLECLAFRDAIDISLMQQLLEQCQSHKVKKLFLSLADRLELEWFDDLDISKISLGTGIQSIYPFEKGQLDKKYNIMIPESILELERW